MTPRGLQHLGFQCFLSLGVHSVGILLTVSPISVFMFNLNAYLDPLATHSIKLEVTAFSRHRQARQNGLRVERLGGHDQVCAKRVKGTWGFRSALFGLRRALQLASAMLDLFPGWCAGLLVSGSSSLSPMFRRRRQFQALLGSSTSDVTLHFRNYVV